MEKSLHTTDKIQQKLWNTMGLILNFFLMLYNSVIFLVFSPIFMPMSLNENKFGKWKEQLSVRQKYANMLANLV